MAHPLTVVDLPLRLLPSGDDQACYRPLAIGRAVLTQSVQGGPWWVQVSLDGTLRPRSSRMPLPRHSTSRTREAVVLISPEDIRGPVRRRAAGTSRHRGGLGQLTGSGIYGWCLLYQPPGMHGIAIIDAHESCTELPAYFELPLELLDRAEFLAHRGIRSRPLALLAQSEDFLTPPEGGPPRNRFLPGIAPGDPPHGGGT
ncbi:MAG: hypothetical protein WCC69_07495 [Pirellulales bacterium]